MDWGLFVHDLFVAAIGAISVLLNQKISKRLQPHFKCLECGIRFSSPNKKLVEDMRVSHKEDVHP